MELIPLRGKILVKVLEDSKRTESGLYLAGVKDEVPHRGKVIAMGLPFMDKNGKEFPWGFGVGHIVHYKRNWDGGKETHQILRRDMIYAIEHNDIAYAVIDYIIIRKKSVKTAGLIFVPSHFASEVAKQVDYAEVVSVGKEDRLGISVGDEIVYYKNEGLAVRIPLKEELWALKPRAILAKI